LIGFRFAALQTSSTQARRFDDKRTSTWPSPAAGRTRVARFDRCMIRFATVGSRLRTAASCKRYCPFGGWSQDELLRDGKAAGEHASARAQ
jgi:hypothetical protein